MIDFAKMLRHAAHYEGGLEYLGPRAMNDIANESPMRKIGMEGPWRISDTFSTPKGRITSQCTGPTLALLAPAGDRGVRQTGRPRRRQTRQGRSRTPRSAHLTVSGYTETARAHECPWWVPTNAIPRLRVGDSVMLRIVDVPHPDRPRSRRRQAKRPLEHCEQREYLRLKAKYAKTRGA